MSESIPIFQSQFFVAQNIIIIRQYLNLFVRRLETEIDFICYSRRDDYWTCQIYKFSNRNVVHSRSGSVDSFHTVIVKDQNEMTRALEMPENLKINIASDFLKEKQIVITCLSNLFNLRSSCLCNLVITSFGISSEHQQNFDGTIMFFGFLLT